MRIRKLSEGTINRIAAGEVLERPASAVKELVENSIDAGATQIDVVFRGGGKALIRVTDNGFGMSADEMVLALERHATSKLSDDELINITTLGFRGEALPSIASVSRMQLTSRAADEVDSFSLAVEAGRITGPSPARLTQGTEIEIRDLFYATPARLKFLKTDKGEVAEAVDVMRRLALAHPAIGFSLATEEKQWLNAPMGESQAARVSRILAADFMTNFYHVQVGTLETQEFRTQPLPFWLVCFSDTAKGQLRLMFFVVLLPDGTVVVPSVAKRTEAVAGPTGAVLIVEDDPAVREMLAMLFEGEGHQTTAVAGSNEALQLAALGALPSDVIIIADYNLPGDLTGARVEFRTSPMRRR